MATVHIEASKTDIAKKVIMPGDPLRAKFIAENFLTDVKQINGVRNMLGYTGYYGKKRVTVMGSGMGQPSMAIYSEELFKFYNVDTIIRVGTSGAMQSGMKLFDVIIGEEALTNSNIAENFGLSKNTVATANTSLAEKAEKFATKNKIKSHKGKIFTSDVFYTPDDSIIKKFIKKGALGVEMESYVLFLNAQRYNKKALTLLTVSDIVGSHEQTTSQERQTAFKDMMKIALEII